MRFTRGTSTAWPISDSMDSREKNTQAWMPGCLVAIAYLVARLRCRFNSRQRLTHCPNDSRGDPA